MITQTQRKLHNYYQKMIDGKMTTKDRKEYNEILKALWLQED